MYILVESTSFSLIIVKIILHLRTLRPGQKRGVRGLGDVRQRHAARVPGGHHPRERVLLPLHQELHGGDVLQVKFSS